MLYWVPGSYPHSLRLIKGRLPAQPGCPARDSSTETRNTIATHLPLVDRCEKPGVRKTRPLPQQTPQRVCLAYDEYTPGPISMMKGLAPSPLGRD